MRPRAWSLLPALLLTGNLLGTGAEDLTLRLRPLLGIRYVEDGGLDERGHWARFSRPDQGLERPGLNCSGFLVAAARRLLDYRGTLAEAGRDRLGDSGPGSRTGRDWDFGWDLVLNLSEGHARAWFLPEGEAPAPGGSGRTWMGFSLHDQAAWARLGPRWRSDRLYLASLQRGRGTQLRHHHVALLLRTAAGQLWFYQTLPGGRVHRLDLGSRAGRDRLCAMFGPSERILILEVAP